MGFAGGGRPGKGAVNRRGGSPGERRLQRCAQISACNIVNLQAFQGERGARISASAGACGGRLGVREGCIGHSNASGRVREGSGGLDRVREASALGAGGFAVTSGQVRRAGGGAGAKQVGWTHADLADRSDTKWRRREACTWPDDVVAPCST